MKSLKNVCESNIIHSVYEVSILGDIDDQIEAYDNSIPDRIEKWIRKNYNCRGTIKISDTPNKDGLHEVIADRVEVKNKNIISLTNGLFKWKRTDNFDCSYCTSLKSLEGAPESTGIMGHFDCSHCPKLESLKGAPKEVGTRFDCSYCPKLESLEGAPEYVGVVFNCSFCDSLKSLKGAPKETRDFYCYRPKDEFTIDDVIRVCKVRQEIHP